MNKRTTILGVVLALVLGGLWAREAIAQYAVHPDLLRPERLRFRLLGNEPISGGNTIVPNSQVWVIRDTKSGACFTVFLIGASSSVAGPMACPD